MSKVIGIMLVVITTCPASDLIDNVDRKDTEGVVGLQAPRRAWGQGIEKSQNKLN